MCSWEREFEEYYSTELIIYNDWCCFWGVILKCISLSKQKSYHLRPPTETNIPGDLYVDNSPGWLRVNSVWNSLKCYFQWNIIFCLFQSFQSSVIGHCQLRHCSATRWALILIWKRFVIISTNIFFQLQAKQLSQILLFILLIILILQFINQKQSVT